MIRIDKLIQELQKFPQGAYAYAYEGEVTGVVVTRMKEDDALGYVPCSEHQYEETGETIFYQKG